MSINKIGNQNTIVWESSQQEHDERLSALSHRLHEKGLAVNADKCLFGQVSCGSMVTPSRQNGLYTSR